MSSLALQLTLFKLYLITNDVDLKVLVTAVLLKHSWEETLMLCKYFLKLNL